MVEKAKKQGSFVSPPVATISESSGIPKRKYFPQACETELRPLFTGQVFIVAEGLLAGDSRGATGGRGWHVRPPMASGPDNRHGAADSTRSDHPPSSHDRPNPAGRQSAHRAIRPCVPRH